MERNIYKYLSLSYWIYNLTKGTMIVDNLANAANYYSLHPFFERAFEFIGQLDIYNAEAGVTEIDGNLLKASVVETKLKPAGEAKLETHKRFIDIQIPVTKAETFGWKALSSLSQPKEGYDTNNDIEFFDDEPSTFVTLMPGEFIIFSPEDGHAPLVGEGAIKKIIIKVAVI
jgi:YhcH/YjgK/YiaL family protein